LNDEVVDLLAELGCFRVWIGSESGSQRILNSMERGVTVEQVQTAVSGCKTRGIQTGMFLMWGYEGEELQDIEATIEHVKRSDPDIFFTTIAYPIKGTPYYQRVSDSLVQLKPWAETSDREITMSNRRPARFYELADRLLRDEVQLARLQRGQARELAGISSLPELPEHELRARIQTARAGLYSSVEAVGA
jgi:radical SAM superfamily enzyme YgiQ (UPF0313 family)